MRMTNDVTQETQFVTANGSFSRRLSPVPSNVLAPSVSDAEASLSMRSSHWWHAPLFRHKNSYPRFGSSSRPRINSIRVEEYLIGVLLVKASAQVRRKRENWMRITAT